MERNKGRNIKESVEVDLDKPLVRGAGIRTPIGSHRQRFIYEDVQDLCNRCMKVGHDEKQCMSIQVGEESTQTRNHDLPMEEASAVASDQLPSHSDLEWSVQYRSKKRSLKTRRANTGEKSSSFPATGEEKTGKMGTDLSANAKAERDKPILPTFGYREIQRKRLVAENGVGENMNKANRPPVKSNPAQRLSRTGNSFTVFEKMGGVEEGELNAGGRRGAGKGPAKKQNASVAVPTATIPAKPMTRSEPTGNPPSRIVPRPSQHNMLGSQTGKALSRVTVDPFGVDLLGVTCDMLGPGTAATPEATSGNGTKQACSVLAIAMPGNPDQRDKELGDLEESAPVSLECNLVLEIEWEKPPNAASKNDDFLDEQLALEFPSMEEEAFNGAVVPFRLSGHKKKLDGKTLRNTGKGDDSNQRRANKLAKVQNS